LEKGPEETRGKILQATAGLMKRMSLKSVTTRAIAKEAGVNESTLFRHFGSKQGIVEAIVQRYSYMPVFRQLFDQVQGDLEKDLVLISQAYQQYMKQHGEMVMIGLREAGTFDLLDENTAKVPKAFKERMMEYFKWMEQKGLLRKTDVEAQAMLFIWMNLGFFVSKSLYGNRITELGTDAFLEHSVATFARGLKP